MHMLNLPVFLYWIEERERIRKKKEAGEPKPWSTDPVFQEVYFCNVRREDDRVTRFIRRMYTPHVYNRWFVHNIILSRFLNWPDTLDHLGFIDVWDPEYVNLQLKERRLLGKVWGNAYVVSTCGRKMDKIDYLTQIVMPSIEKVLGVHLPWERCSDAAHQLSHIEGISTFMAGQVVADLKNTVGYPLMMAPDWDTFVLIGPGSRRGMGWLLGEQVTDFEWYDRITELRIYLKGAGWDLHAQDIQNCLCEFDKYCRVSTGKGRSKRSYNGI